MTEDEQPVLADAVRAELDRILASPRFDASERNRGFLRFVVDEALAGHADRIKAYTIATEVFGRDSKFDPQLDSIVRIEAGRLRRSIERYYLTDGLSSRIRIEIPRGGYVPVFGSAAPGILAPAATGSPRVLVTAFEEEGDHSAFPSFTRGFTRSLVIALTRFPGLCVYGTDTALRQPDDVDSGATRREFAADYIVTGQTSLRADRFEVDVLLVEAATGRSVWAEAFERRLDPADIIALRSEVANRVARALARPYGAIQSDRARDIDGQATGSLGSYAAISLFYACWRTFDGEMIDAVRIGPERSVAAKPGYAEAHACQSLVYTNSFRFRRTIGEPDPGLRCRALALAGRAVEFAPSSSWARYALGLARWFTGDADAAIEALEAGRALNPNDTTILADLGQRYATLARWDEALPLLRAAYSANPAQPNSFRIGLFLYHYAHGRFAEALAEARRIDTPTIIYGHAAVAVAAAVLGLEDEAGEAVAAIQKLDPDYGNHVVADLERRHLAPALVPLIVRDLKKAGLPVIVPLAKAAP